MAETTKTVVLSKKAIFAGASAPHGGWNARQLLAIGITWADHQKVRWIDRHVGREVTAEQYAEFIALKGATKAKEEGLFPIDSEFDRKLRDERA